MDISNVIISVSIPSIIMLMSILVAPKVILKHIKYALTDEFLNGIMDNLESKLKKDVEEWLNSEKGQKALYSIGGMIGAGARQGIGLGKGGGKFSFADLATQIVGGFFNKQGQQTPSGQQSQTL